MSTPVLHVLAGPNGSGKSTFVALVLGPVTHLPFVNADVLAAQRWSGEEQEHAYEAARMASRLRDEAIAQRRSFIAETVFSHASKVELVAQAVAAGYLVELHAMLIPEGLAVARVADRVARGGHRVPDAKIRERYRRLWPLVAAAVPLAQRATFYDNASARTPFRAVASYVRGVPGGATDWPAWTPQQLLTALPATS